MTIQIPGLPLFGDDSSGGGDDSSGGGGGSSGGLKMNTFSTLITDKFIITTTAQNFIALIKGKKMTHPLNAFFDQANDRLSPEPVPSVLFLNLHLQGYWSGAGIQTVYTTLSGPVDSTVLNLHAPEMGSAETLSFRHMVHADPADALTLSPVIEIWGTQRFDVIKTLLTVTQLRGV